ncbi:unnamed protein product [Linum tenue]|uniref:NPH3 domain-containing protein n=1 Tax=Linum tenue TaxID=586396 RepID=A0AAV0J5W5_9ROSI|nr:unnamed protein product [Linum tenue]
MTDKVRSGNLLSQTEDFLEGMLDWPLPDVVSCLKTCDSFFPYADSLGLLQKLVSGLLVKIAGGRCNSADNSSASSPSSSPFALDEARLDDLLVCGNGGGGGSVYDVDLVIRLVRIFVNSMNQNQSQKMRRVVRVIDEYLREISPDHNLNMPKFVEVAESLPKSARDSFDGVYRAIDIYLESHPTLSFKERSRLCRCLNFDKLSMETCKEIAKNPKFPPTVAVQALMSKTSMLPTPLMPPSPAQGDHHHHHHHRQGVHDKTVEIISKSASLSESPRMAKVKEKKKNVGLPDLHVKLDKYTCSPARGTQAKRQVVVPVSEDKGEKMEMNIVRMQKRVVELERACTEMKNQMSRTTTEHHNDSGPPYDGDAGGGLKLMAVLPSSCGESLGRICF